MKTTRIEIEGEIKSATIYPYGQYVIVAVNHGDHSETLRARADAPEKLDVLARTTQMHCDGYAGTAGDVADYRRMIECFAE
jgi:hypothetical protein